MVDGPKFYDDEKVFETYSERRKQQDNPNDALEMPIVLELIGNVKYANILDLGCGSGDFGTLMLSMGCHSYTGVEASYNMITLARKTLTSKRAELIYSRIENCDFQPAYYHLIVSRLVLHYIEDLDDLFAKLRPALQQGGRFVFSVEHPILTSHNESLALSGGKRSNWIVDNYFRSGVRNYQWKGGEVTKYHRTLEDYFKIINDNGFRIVNLREAKPKRENFASEEEFERRHRIPLFLFFSLEAKPD